MARRNQDPIWIQFDRFVATGTPGWKVKCILCQKEMQGMANQIKQHYANCGSNTQDSSTEVIQISQKIFKMISLVKQMNITREVKKEVSG